MNSFENCKICGKPYDALMHTSYTNLLKAYEHLYDIGHNKYVVKQLMDSITGHTYFGDLKQTVLKNHFPKLYKLIEKLLILA
jgi:hypothetical protein